MVIANIFFDFGIIYMLHKLHYTLGHRSGGNILSSVLNFIKSPTALKALHAVTGVAGTAGLVYGIKKLAEKKGASIGPPGYQFVPHHLIHSTPMGAPKRYETPIGPQKVLAAHYNHIPGPLPESMKQGLAYSSLPESMKQGLAYSTEKKSPLFLYSTLRRMV